MADIVIKPKYEKGERLFGLVENAQERQYYFQPITISKVKSINFLGIAQSCPQIIYECTTRKFNDFANFEESDLYTLDQLIEGKFIGK